MYCKKDNSSKLAIYVFIALLFLSNAVQAEVEYFYGDKEAGEFIALLKKSIQRIEKDFWGDVAITIGRDGLVLALKARKNNIVAAYISRWDYELLIEKYKRRDVSVLYFDPSPDQINTLAVSLVENSLGASHRLGLFASPRSAEWFARIQGLNVKMRKPGAEASSLLQGDIRQHLFILPADNDVVSDVSLTDLITTLLEKGTGLIGFSPYLKNTAANVYYEPKDYVTEFSYALKYSEGVFRRYPSAARFSVNKRTLSAIGVRYKGVQQGELDEI